MKRKIVRYSMLCSYLLLMGGCSIQKTSLDPEAQVQVITELAQMATKSEVGNQMNITGEDMEKFFATYLTIDEASILTLNQKPKIIHEDYWEAYGVYKTKTNQILGSYLSVAAKDKLDKQYIHDDFHYPRLLEINDYMMTGFSQVEDAVIISKSIKNDYNVYEVMVTAIASVIPMDAANEQYQWDESKGYYKANTRMELGLVDETQLRPDKIKVTLKYLVETIPGETFMINSVKESSGIYLGIDEQTSIKNNSFIGRLPYGDEVEDKDQQKINQFLESFMKQDYNFYQYYRKAYHTSYEMFEIVLAGDLGLRNIINLNKDYQLQFSPLIIPLKDDIASLEFNVQEDVTIEPHLSSTKNHPAYEVVVTAEATLVDGGVKIYEYTYLFTFKNDMILSVRFINQNDISINEPLL